MIGRIAFGTTKLEGNADKANAEFENGVLTLRLPKAPEVRPKTIEVKPTGHRDRRQDLVIAR